MKHDRWTRQELDDLYDRGRLPIDVPLVMRIDQAAGACLDLPPAETQSDGWVVGYGLLPPVGAEPLVRIKGAMIDPYNRPVLAGTVCRLGALWRDRRRPDQVVHRLWCNDPDKGPHGMVGPLDVYVDQIAGTLTLQGKIPTLIGWQICRLDHGRVTTEQVAESLIIGRG